MEVHQFSGKIGKCKFLIDISSVPGALGQVSVQQCDQTAKSRGFQINAKRPLLHLMVVKAPQPKAFLLVVSHSKNEASFCKPE